jgi:hypothetical protein
MKRSVLGVLVVGLLLVPLSAPPAPAEIGSGWVSMPVGGYIDYQVEGKHHRHDLSSFRLPSAYYARSGGSEEFGLETSQSNRMEHDTNHHYNKGRRQFQGDLRVFPGISQQSVVQIFGGGPGGPILMIKCYGRNNGSLVVTRDTSKNMITNAFTAGKIRVNLIHDVDDDRLSIYINGSQKWTGPDAGSSYRGSYNIKYGLYGTFRSRTHTVWSDVKMWR